MLKTFLYDINDWNFFNYLFGNDRLTYVSDFSFSTLNYYKGLFSYTDNSKAFSVIYHSYVMRVIYDHGLFFLTVLIYSLRNLLKNTILFNYETIAFIFILLINGLSVSSFNNFFFAISFFILLTVYDEKQVNKKQQK